MSTRRRTYGLMNLLGSMKYLGKFSINKNISSSSFTPSSTGGILIFSYSDTSDKFGTDNISFRSNSFGTIVWLINSNTTLYCMHASGGYHTVTINPSAGTVKYARSTSGEPNSSTHGNVIRTSTNQEYDLEVIGHVFELDA